MVQVIAPGALKNALCGLCGTFNDRAADDYVPKDSKVYEDDVNLFALSWKEESDAVCEEDSANILPVSQTPCDKKTVSSIVKVMAEENCNVLKTSPHFEKCHDAVDVNPYFTK